MMMMTLYSLFAIVLLFHSILAESSSDTHSIDLTLRIAQPGTNPVILPHNRISSQRTQSTMHDDDNEVTQQLPLTRIQESITGTNDQVRRYSSNFLY